jgi:siderophore synthetase component
VAHLRPEQWEQANRMLVCKALAEFAHERLLVPEPDPEGGYRVRAGEVEYRFTAQRLALEHWRVDAASVRRVEGGVDTDLDAAELVWEFRDDLGIDPATLPVYLEEITSTLASATYKLASGPRPAADVAGAEFQDVESAMTEGHPCFVANNGRLGFDAAEYLRYAPEAAPSVQLLWVAVPNRLAAVSQAAGLDYRDLLRSELGGPTLAAFARVLAERGWTLDDVALIPVHPWQWWNRLAVTFAADVARGDLVLLGAGPDSYRPQQSIRTFFNISEPRKHYVKTALSVLNMGFLRGLSADYLEATPAINDWVRDLVDSDAVLRGARFGILTERAAVGYRGGQYERATGKGSPYRKMLAALWRESPVPSLGPGERLMTMAALLHTDPGGDPTVAALVARSGLPPADWLDRYLDAYLRPLLHCFYAHSLVFMPHGENVILVLESDVPVRVLVKDIAEEIAVLDESVPLPSGVERVRAEVPEDLRVLSLFTDVFDSFLRFLAATFHSEKMLDEREFWRGVAGCVRRYQESVPELAGAFSRYDLFAASFPLSCLNRLQLRNNLQMVDLADPAGSLSLAGRVENPIAPFAGGR